MAVVTAQPLYLITDGGELRRKGVLIDTIQKALEGADGLIAYVQLREQIFAQTSASDEEVLELIEQLLGLCHSHQAQLIVNRRPDLAKAGGADGVHLGGKTLSIAEAREILGEQATIGYSAHMADEAQGAHSAGASYVFISPVFPSLSKSNGAIPFGLDNLKTLSSEFSGLLYALGGICVENAGACRRAGVSGVAMISSLLFVGDAKRAARDMRNAWRMAAG